MALFEFKRETKSLKRSVVSVLGPLDQNFEVPEGVPAQELKFNQQERSVAIVDLTPGALYTAYYHLIGAKSATYAASLTLQGSGNDSISIRTITIPKDLDRPKNAFGFSYKTNATFYAPGGEA